MNVKTGQSRLLWGGNFFRDYAIDREHHLAALSTEDGLYLVSFDGSYRKISDQFPIWALKYRGGAKSSFLGYDWYGQAILIANDGTITPTAKPSYISISPDYRWVALAYENYVELYSKTDELVLTLSRGGGVIWRPDSAGFYLSSYTTHPMLYYVSLPDGEPVLVDECQLRDCYYNDYVWLP